MTRLSNDIAIASRMIRRGLQLLDTEPARARRGLERISAAMLQWSAQVASVESDLDDAQAEVSELDERLAEFEMGERSAEESEVMGLVDGIAADELPAIGADELLRLLRMDEEPSWDR